MAFPTETIKLEAAQKIFEGAQVEAHQVGNKVAYYSARFRGEEILDTSLTALCSILWSRAISDR